MNKKKIIIISASCVVGIALIIAAAILFTSLFKGGKAKQTDASSSSAVSSTEIKPTKGFDVTVGSVSSEKGKAISVPVKIAGNPGTMGYLVEFDYDKTKLTYSGFDKGDVISDCELSEKDGVIKLVALAENDTTKNGTLVYLNFKVADNAKSGDTEIKLVCKDNAICNYNEQVVVPNTANGKVTIK